MIVVAFRVHNVVRFNHENLSFFLGEDAFCGEIIIPKGLRGSQLSFKFTIHIYEKGGVKMKKKYIKPRIENLGDLLGSACNSCYPTGSGNCCSPRGTS